jgi:16S rRNA (cytosine967-C5)-methyltransferase
LLDSQRLASATVAAVCAGRSLTDALAALWKKHAWLTAQQRGAITDISYGVLRFRGQLEQLLDLLLARPPDGKLRSLLLVALYQLQYSRAAPYAIVDQAVRCTRRLREPQAAGLVNAVLRGFLRRRHELVPIAERSDVGRYSYPQWWIDKLRAQYPQHFAAVLEAGNRHPALTLRVNQRHTSREAYLRRLIERAIAGRAVGAAGVILERALPVDRIPGFAEGAVSVQDAAAQLAAELLDAKAGMRILDACAAPGGKTGHLLELADVELIALDNDSQRLDRVRDNLSRLKLLATLRTGDAGEPRLWWDGVPFERILADVPCTASGVVRRHPDIKWLRRPDDVSRFVQAQRRILDALWQMLARGGKLLYTTCSVFEEENSQQVADFLARRPDARFLPLCGIKRSAGIPEGQLLPDEEHDGFFYALLQKS